MDRKEKTLTIFHLDLDSFYVSAERLRHPLLRNKKVAIGGTGPRSVISSASYEARKFGVRSAMPTAQALRLCPELIMVEHDFDYYSQLSCAVFDIVSRYSPEVDQVSVDEAYIDMTGTESLWGPPETAAKKMRKEIFDKTGLTASVGISPTRLVSKIASDCCKPNGCLFVRAGQEPKFLASFEISKIPGCGPVSKEKLNYYGFYTIADLQKSRPETLKSLLGSMGPYFYYASFGQEIESDSNTPKSRGISRERTYSEDLNKDDAQIKKHLWSLCQELGQELRENQEQAKSIRLKLRFPPFKTITRQCTVGTPTALTTEIYREVIQLFDRFFKSQLTEHKSIRLIGVGCVLAEKSAQLDLFSDQPYSGASQSGDTKVKQLKLENLQDTIRAKFGPDALKTGRDVPANFKQRKESETP